MLKQITVMKTDGSTMLPTFYKRAKQLVKTGRAQWINESAICLLEENAEEIYMDQSNGSRSFKPDGVFNEAGYAIAPEPVDEEIYKLAKRRVQERAALITHIAVYIMVNLFLIAVDYDSDGWQIYVILGWGIGLVCHIVSYFVHATPMAVQKEYLKLKNKYYR